jgi:uncharacterized membrane protein
MGGLLISILIIAVILFLLDAVWFYSVGGWLIKQIRTACGETTMRFGAAAVVYAIMGTMIVALQPSVFEAFMLGIGVYGVYEFTNYATITNWTREMVLVDTLWGGVVFAAATAIARQLHLLGNY